MPSANEARPSKIADIDWSRLFAEARLDPARFSPVEPPSFVPVSADARAAWIGPSPDGAGVPLRIEAAAFAGRPVYFKIIAPWTSPPEPAVPAETVLLGGLFLILLS